MADQDGDADDRMRHLLQDTVRDPLRFDEFLVHWNASFDPDCGRPGPAGLVEMADDALAAIEREAGADPVGARIRRLINTFTHAALLVRPDGRIIAMNTVAIGRLDVDIGDSIDAIAYELDGGEAISTVVAGLAERPEAAQGLLLKHAHDSRDARTTTLVIIPAPARKGRLPWAMVFVIDPEVRQTMTAMMAHAFSLTESEASVLTAFLNGSALADIARQRGRSLATVRTQFQTVMAKTGARSQAELMRNALALSQFSGEIDTIAEIAAFPHRKTAQVLRRGGRTVDLTLAGDMQGQPVLMLSSVTRHTMPARIEAQFAARGLLAVHLWRPGFGGTDPAPAGEAPIATLAADVAAVQDQLQIAACPLVAFDAAIYDAVALGAHNPRAFTRILTIGAVLPRPFQRMQALRAPWAEAMLRAGGASPTVLRLMVRSGFKAWRILGSRRFTRMQIGNNAADLATTEDPLVLAEADRALTQSNAQGIEANVQDMMRVVGDWSDLCARCPVPIEFLHGSEDPLTDIASVRAFVARYSDRARLTEIEGAGFQTLISHTDAVLDRLSDAARASTPPDRHLQA